MRKEGTVVIAPAAVAEKGSGAITLANGETVELDGFSATAIPMYDLVRPSCSWPGAVFGAFATRSQGDRHALGHLHASCGERS